MLEQIGNRPGLSENMVRFRLLVRLKLLAFVHFTDGMMILKGESLFFSYLSLADLQDEL